MVVWYAYWKMSYWWNAYKSRTLHKDDRRRLRISTEQEDEYAKSTEDVK
jgi:hypothetical protein